MKIKELTVSIIIYFFICNTCQVNAQGGDPPYTLKLGLIESSGFCGNTSGCESDSTICLDIVLVELRNNSGVLIDTFYSESYNLWVTYPVGDFTIIDDGGNPMEEECVNSSAINTPTDEFGGFRLAVNLPNAIVTTGTSLHNFCLKYSDFSVLESAQICVVVTFFGVKSVYDLSLGPNSSTDEQAATEDSTLILEGGCITLSDTTISCLMPDCATLSIKAFLEGPYDEGSGQMSTTLNEYHLLPGQDPKLSLDPAAAFFGIPSVIGQPYDTIAWNYNGTEGDVYGDSTTNIGSIDYPSTATDWVLVSVREKDSLAMSEIWKCAALLHKDGVVEIPAGCGCLTLIPAQKYFILVEHRNHLPVMSQVLSPIDNVLSFDFTQNQSWINEPVPGFFLGNGQKQMIDGRYTMYTGNGNSSTWISENSIDSDDRLIWDINQNKRYQYLGSDYNLDGNTLSDDRVKWDINQNVRSFILW